MYLCLLCFILGLPSFARGDSNVCGSVSRSTAGSFGSPDRDGDGLYDHNVDCFWNLTADDNHVVLLRIWRVDIKSRDDDGICRHDGLEIFDGDVRDFSRVGIYCDEASLSHVSLPITITSTTTRLYVRFHTDEAEHGVGFNATYSHINDPFMGCHRVLTDTAGVLRSPDTDGDGKYDHNRKCFWTVIAEEGKILQLSRQRMDLKGGHGCTQDYLKLYDGLFDDKGLMGTYCDSRVPPAKMMTTGNILYALFSSDDRNNGNGFIVNFAQIDGPGQPCGALLKEDSGWFGPSDSDNSGVYDNHLTCWWILLADPQKDILFTITDVDIPSGGGTACSGDSLYIYNGFTQKILLGAFCNENPPPTGTLRSKAFYLHFSSDAQNGGTGFNASFYQVQDFVGTCGGYLTDTSGELGSLDVDGDGQYEINRYCHWIIKRQDGNKLLQLKIQYMDIETGQICRSDYLKVYDGIMKEEALIGKYCNFFLPRTIVTSSKRLHVVFFSDGSVTGAGFNATYNHIDGIIAPGKNTELIYKFGDSQGFSRNRADLDKTTQSIECGSILTGTTGNFGYIDSEENRLHHGPRDCLWEIRGNTRQPVQITFSSITLQNDPGCTSEWIKVYADEVYYQDSVIDTYCGSVDQFNVITDSAVIYVLFHSDTETQGSGFTANYSLIKGSEQTCGGYLNDSSGWFSPNDINNDGIYDFNLYCFWSVIASENKVVRVDFPDMDIEESENCTFDNLKVYDGSITENNLIGKYCGSTPPDAISSRSSSLYVEFYSDESISGKGFNATYTIVHDPCNGRMTDPFGAFSSVDRDGNGHYDANLNCTWLIIAEGNKALQLKIISLDIEVSKGCTNDYLMICDGLIGEEISSRTFCGRSVPSKIMATSNALTVKFVSDDQGDGAGFMAEYSISSDSGHTCGLSLEAEQGFFSLFDTDGDGFYENNLLCKWTIIEEELNVIYIQILSMDIEEEANCAYDFLNIYDQSGSDSAVSRKYCGSTIPTMYRSGANVVYVRFVSDSGFAGVGFSAIYSAGYEDDCGGVLNSVSGSRIQHNARVSNCLWTIIAGENEVIYMDVTSIVVGGASEKCTVNYIEIKENEDTVIGTYCTSNPPAKIKSISNILIIHLRTENTIVTFDAIFFQRTKGVSTDCGGVITDMAGWFRPLDKDGDGYYENNLNCDWLIIAEEGHLIQLNIEDMQIEEEANCEYDFLKVFDGVQEESDSNLMGIYCGTVASLLLKSTTTRLYLNFFSDLSENRRGFNATYHQIAVVSNECGGMLTDFDGQFSSPDIDNDGQYDINLHCHWTIEVEDGHMIQLTILDIDVEKDERCRYDFIKVYDGIDENADLLETFCGDERPPIIRSFSNSLLVRFYSDWLLNGRGFTAAYTQVNEYDWRRWPDGNYAVLSSVYGCPDPDVNRWEHGYMNISFRDPHNLQQPALEDIMNRNSSMLLGPNSQNRIQLNFCGKITGSDDFSTTAEWPRGKYSIYKTGDTCPSGFTEFTHEITIPKIEHMNIDGIQPKYNILSVNGDQESTIQFRLCDKTHIQNTITFQTETRFPFILLLLTEGSTEAADDRLNHSSPFNSRVRKTDILMEATAEEIQFGQESFIVIAFIAPIGNSLVGVRKAERFPHREIPWNLGIPDASSHDEVSWLMYDLDQSVVVSKLRFIYNFNEDKVPLETSIPTILLGQTKWSYLGNGAIQCFGYLEHNVSSRSTDVICLNTPYTTGKYIILMDRNTTSANTVESILVRLMTMLVISTEASSSCNQVLGMRDGSIQDFQISASSEHPDYPTPQARPDATGWCSFPYSTPQEEFLQIDLLIPMTIEGVQFFNLPEARNLQNAVGYDEYIVGAYQIIMQFSMEAYFNTGQIPQKEFYFDKTLLFEDGQTFIFASTVFARTVKIIPLLYTQKPGMKCLKVELIGCRMLGTTSSQCSSRPESSWFQTRQPYLPLYQEAPSRSVIVINAQECQTICLQATQYCSTVLYDDAHAICSWFDESATYSYRDFDAEGTNVDAYDRICQTDMQDKRKDAVLYLLYEQEWESITTHIDQSAVIVSHNFPFHYVIGGMWAWDISFQGSSYINMIVYNMSLSTYTVPSSITQNLLRFSDRTDRLYIGNIDYRLNSIFTDTPINNTDGLMYWLDSSHNGQLLHYQTNLKKLVLLFRTRVQDLPIESTGSGFRIYAYSSGNPICIPFEDCYWDSALLISRSFLGEFSYYYEDTWLLHAGPTQYISLLFDDFDIGCETGTLLDIEFTKDTRLNYCNKNRPIERLTSIENQLTVLFRLNRVAYFLMEGFSARYKTIEQLQPDAMELANETISIIDSENQSLQEALKDHSAQMLNIKQSYDQSYVYGQTNVNAICSPYWQKCYILFSDLDVTEFKSWSLFEENVCELNGWTLATFHSQQEQDFVGYHLLHEFNTTNNVFTYIGLKRELQPTGYYYYNWVDGSPVTFLAWAEGHPLPQQGQDCAMMRLRLSEAYTWESIPCFEPKAVTAVCEYKLNASSDVGYNNENDVKVPQDESSQGQSFDRLERSSYFLCQSEETINLLGLCNGVEDCLDGSDEIGCINTTDACMSTQFRCGDGKCVPISVLCDHFIDCIDQSDENCYFPTCEANEYTCGSGQCVHMSLRCDGKGDCKDASDEDNCVSSNCNDGTSFLCGSAKCIPWSYVCDGIAECPDGGDEDGCEFPKTCQQWWDAGYHVSGIYKIRGEDVECDFDTISKDNSITTRYHSIDVGRLITGTYGLSSNRFSYNNEPVLQDLIKDSECHQSIEQLCLPWIQPLYEIEKNSSSGPHHACRCLSYTTKLSIDRVNEQSVIKDCKSGEVPNLPHKAFHMELEKHYLYSYYLSVKVKNDRNFDVGQMRMNVKPITCSSEFEPIVPRIACGFGFDTSEDTRCLYNLDIYENIIGCRSLQHLQNCASFICPSGYYKCRNSYCVERRYVCDGIKHCEYGEDEDNCDKMSCPSQYRCQGHRMCLSMEMVCDGHMQCPYGDDERLCDFRCPEGCHCFGYTVDCKTTRLLSGDNGTLDMPQTTRMLDVSGNPNVYQRLNLHDATTRYFIHLNISSCEIRNLSAYTFSFMSNLLVLDISYNRIQTVASKTFDSQLRLKILKIDGNMDIISFETEAFAGLKSMKVFSVTYQQIGTISRGAFLALSLEVLDLSFNTINMIEDNAFENLFVKRVYVNESNILSFSQDMFRGLEGVETIVSIAYKFCCIKPTYLAEKDCYPQQDEFSSCSDLMRNEILRSLIWIIGLFSLLGNAFSILYRITYDKARLKFGYGIFVSNLALSDFIMGVYLIIIAGADVALRDIYIFNDESWRMSAGCQFAGVLAALSSESSIIFMILITIDRLLVIKYPFGQIKITQSKANYFSLIAWGLGLIIAVIPLIITPYFKGEFYSKSGVCLALPLTRDRPAGWMYSISIFIGFNSITFLLIALGQWWIYSEISASKKSIAGKVARRSNDLRIARNLLLVVTTDFLCWFPIGILGILALTDQVIPGDVYAWTAVFVLPINSALNPFLYTVTAIISKDKFAPDTKEQSRVEMVPKGHLASAVDTWKRNCYLKFSVNLNEFISLEKIIEQNNLPFRKCIIIAKRSIRCLYGIHARGLVQRNFTINDFRIRKTKQKRLFVALDFRPKVVTKPKETAANIEIYGKMLIKLFKRWDPLRKDK